MRSITLNSHVGPDGLLKLDIPTDLSDVDVEVVVIVQPSDPSGVDGRAWPTNFFEQTYGLYRDHPLVREPQGEYEVRDVTSKSTPCGTPFARSGR